MLQVRAGCTRVTTFLLALTCLLLPFQAHGRDIACGATGFDSHPHLPHIHTHI